MENGGGNGGRRSRKSRESVEDLRYRRIDQSFLEVVMSRDEAAMQSPESRVLRSPEK